MAKNRLLVCPWCGETQTPRAVCSACGGGFDPEARRATLNAMGPWWVRDRRRPFHPGCSYETLVQRIARGEITASTIMRGPTTRQMWAAARRVPAVAHLVGHCHACDKAVEPDDLRCPACRAVFGAWMDRNHLGLPAIRSGADEVPDLDDEPPGPRGRPTRPSGGTSPSDAAGSRALDRPDASAGVSDGAASQRSAAGDPAATAAPSTPRPTGGALARRTVTRPGIGVDAERVRRVAYASWDDLTYDMTPARTSGTWTASIAGLTFLALALIATPLVIAIVRGHDGSTVAGAMHASDAPTGLFRPATADEDGDDAVTDPAVVVEDRAASGTAGAAETPDTSAPVVGREEPRAPRVDTAALTDDGDASADGRPAASSVDPVADDDPAADGERDADADGAIDASDDATAPPRGLLTSDPAWRLRQLRRTAANDGLPWAERLEAWHAASRLLDGLEPARDGEPWPVDRADIRVGLDRVHLEAFLSGASPRAIHDTDARWRAGDRPMP